MSWVATAVAVSTGAQLYQARQNRIEARKAEKRAKKDALKDRIDARRAEVFAETEGQGIGQLGNVDLAIDDELDPTGKLRSKKLRAGV